MKFGYVRSYCSRHLLWSGLASARLADGQFSGRAEARSQILRRGFGQRASDGLLAPAVPAPHKVSLRQKDTFILQPHGGYGNTLQLDSLPLRSGFGLPVNFGGLLL